MSKATRNRTYRMRLQVIGARLDAGGFHSASILEVDGGLIVRATPPGSRTPEVIEIVDGEGTELPESPRASTDVPHRLFPNGYAHFLGALGCRLDHGRASAIAIVEGTDFVTVGGIQQVSKSEDGIAFEPLDILLLQDDIEAIARQPLATSARQISLNVSLPGSAPTANGAPRRITNRVSAMINALLRAVQFD